NYHLFRALQHFLVAKKFDNIDSTRNNVEKYFNKKKTKTFCSDGIMDSPKRWKEVVKREGG
ncbi:hypothetical protein WH47_02337, partial [Habropoda laboriosa]